MGKSVKRIVDTDFWNDELIVDRFTPEDKYFMLYLLTNPHTRQSGIYKILKKQMVFETGYSKETINFLLERVENYGLIKYSHDTQEIAILNYLKYSVVKGGKPVNDCIRKDLESVKDRTLIKIVSEHLDSYFKMTTKISMLDIKEIIKENVNDNKNDNDNERIVNESYGQKNIPYKSIIEHLNKKIGSNYSFNTTDTQNKIKARWNERIKDNKKPEEIFKEFILCINNAHEHWSKDNNFNYMRPKTLFNGDMENRVNGTAYGWEMRTTGKNLLPNDIESDWLDDYIKSTRSD